MQGITLYFYTHLNPEIIFRKKTTSRRKENKKNKKPKWVKRRGKNSLSVKPTVSYLNFSFKAVINSVTFQTARKAEIDKQTNHKSGFW